MSNSEYIEKVQEAINFFDKYDYENAHLVVLLREAAKAYINLLEYKEWAVVPVSPSDHMQEKGYEELETWNDPYDGGCISPIYKAMITAAPHYQPEKLDE